MITFLNPPAISLSHRIPDLILLDIGPDNKRNKDYFDFLKSNRSTMSIPVILTSTLVGLRSVAKDWKADAFLSKPFDVDFIVSLVNGLLI